MHASAVSTTRYGGTMRNARRTQKRTARRASSVVSSRSSIVPMRNPLRKKKRSMANHTDIDRS